MCFYVTLVLTIANSVQGCLEIAEHGARVKLEGTWLLKKAESDGNRVPDRVLDELKLEWTFGNRTLRIKNNPLVASREELATYRVRVRKDVCCIDIMDSQGKTMEGIFSVEKDKLTICIRPAGWGRPTVFRSEKKPSAVVLEFVRSTVKGMN